MCGGRFLIAFDPPLKLGRNGRRSFVRRVEIYRSIDLQRVDVEGGMRGQNTYLSRQLWRASECNVPRCNLRRDALVNTAGAFGPFI